MYIKYIEILKNVYKSIFSKKAKRSAKKATHENRF